MSESKIDIESNGESDLGLEANLISNVSQAPNSARWDVQAQQVLRMRHQRRKEERVRSVEDRAWMQWWDDGECHGCSARLVNVSRGGAMLVTPTLLRINQKISLFLEFADPEIRAKATVLGILEGKYGLHQVRVSFDEGCPESFYQAAAYGFEAWLQKSNAIDQAC